MHAASFPCPHCSTPLRVRDRRFVGRTIACPDCQAPVQVCESGDGEIRGVAVEVADATGQPSSIPSVSSQQVGWIVAGAMVLGLVAFMLLPRPQPTQRQAEQPLIDNAQPALLAEPAKIDGESPQVAAQTAGSRLAALWEELDIAQDGGSHVVSQFPRGTVPAKALPVDQRFSWLAALAAAQDPDGPQPRWDRPWNDPDNDAFVRRQQPRFLNPHIGKDVSDDRYPATNFVGMAGVGSDAADLPIDHPRAGIFGHDRRTRLDDVGDGLGNTILIAGTTDAIGSWAAGGTASVRGFSAEPYVNGPDGFGTGQRDGMHVLMADGSVRFLSAETSPVIIRRMAAMNDRLPLDASVPGEPGERPTQPSQDHVASAAPNAKPANVKPMAERDGEPKGAAGPIDAARIIADLAQVREQPIEVPLAEPAIVYDVEQALSQRIAKFDQRDPIPVRDLLRLVEEMAAVPFHFDEMPPDAIDRLSQPVTLSLTKTTVGGILRTIGEKTQLSFDERPAGVFVIGPSAKPNSTSE